MPKRISSFRSPQERARPSRKRAAFRRYGEEDKTTTERGYGIIHQRLRTQLLQAEPWCREHKRRGLLRAATIADHIVPLGQGGAKHDITNMQPLCKACSDAKTARESAQARKA